MQLMNESKLAKETYRANVEGFITREQLRKMFSVQKQFSIFCEIKYTKSNEYTGVSFVIKTEYISPHSNFPVCVHADK